MSISTTLKNLLNLLGLVIIAAGAYFYLHPEGIPASLEHAVNLGPCDKPIVYTVGTVDPKFGMSRTEYISLAERAAAVWNTAAGKTVLAYSTTTVKGAMPVRLVFDQREATVLLGQSIDSAQSTTDAERASIMADEAQLTTLKDQYETAQTAFNQKAADYQQQVSYWNARGGASGATYTNLKNEQRELQTEEASLNQQAKDINTQNDALNQRIAAYNAEIKNTNQKIAAFDTQAGEFEQGVYQKTATSTSITVYAYKNVSELTRTLEHEFGHSLGLDHNQNPDSIMYPYIKDIATGPSADDLAALKQACGW